MIMNTSVPRKIPTSITIHLPCSMTLEGISTWQIAAGIIRTIIEFWIGPDSRLFGGTNPCGSLPQHRHPLALRGIRRSCRLGGRLPRIVGQGTLTLNDCRCCVSIWLTDNWGTSNHRRNSYQWNMRVDPYSHWSRRYNGFVRGRVVDDILNIDQWVLGIYSSRPEPTL
jgi:hypothetical protein